METVEQMIIRKGLTAPRITPQMVEDEIAEIQYTIMANSTVTICVITLKNGFKVTGESACASPANFDKDVGERVARDNAKQKIWPLLGFRLRDQLSAAAKD